MAIPLRVLFIGEAGADAVSAELQRSGYEPIFHKISTAQELTDALASSWDVAIADLAIGDFGAIAALHIIQEQGVDRPLMAVTGKIRDADVRSVLKAGAADHRLLQCLV